MERALIEIRITFFLNWWIYVHMQTTNILRRGLRDAPGGDRTTRGGPAGIREGKQSINGSEKLRFPFPILTHVWFYTRVLTRWTDHSHRL